ncbi:hypothetical protein EVAR_90986_1 [Eumeta japonica]|uniref:Uncharacterized protein n=1 Tax=Eumeta variegata TaxID=151549 RepID=A0A4C1T1Q8_EUMVA|nr:hypothetical protein EVAR_90986_1 [Eumeta japonica]
MNVDLRVPGSSQTRTAIPRERADAPFDADGESALHNDGVCLVNSTTLRRRGAAGEEKASARRKPRRWCSITFYITAKEMIHRCCTDTFCRVVTQPDVSTPGNGCRADGGPGNEQ